MRISLTIAASIILTLIFCRASFADGCRSDLECNMYKNERCVKSIGEDVGVCLKTEYPKEKKTSEPPRTPPSSSIKRGHFCSDDKDCDPGQSCVKKDNGMFGACF
jgi:hypothetical protein